MSLFPTGGILGISVTLNHLLGKQIFFLREQQKAVVLAPFSIPPWGSSARTRRDLIQLCLSEWLDSVLIRNVFSLINSQLTEVIQTHKGVFVFHIRSLQRGSLGSEGCPQESEFSVFWSTILDCTVWSHGNSRAIPQCCIYVSGKRIANSYLHLISSTVMWPYLAVKEA